MLYFEDIAKYRQGREYPWDIPKDVNLEKGRDLSQNVRKVVY